MPAQDESTELLSAINDIIESRKRILLPHNELQLAIEQQTKVLEELTKEKSKEAPYAMVRKLVMEFILNGGASELVLDGSENSTANLLKTNVHQLATSRFQDYSDLFPAQKFMLDLKDAPEEDLMILQDALDGDLEGLVYMSKLFQLKDNKEAHDYWQQLVSQKSELRTVEKGLETTQSVKETGADVPQSVKKIPAAADLDEKLTSSELELQSKLKTIPGFVLSIFRLQDGILRSRTAFDSAKLSAYPVCLFIALVFGQLNNPTMMTYTSLHGTYGLLWVAKSHLFPDTARENKISVTEFITIYALLFSYYLPPFLIAYNAVQLHPVFLSMIISIYVIGVFFHFTSDVQKTIVWSFKKGLITDKLYAVCRHPNYFGEFLVYFALGLLTGSLVGLVPLALWMVLIWFPNMRKKE
jgi:protein-S-isoprenylcysteine O-methyltransferase Ste14